MQTLTFVDADANANATANVNANAKANANANVNTNADAGGSTTALNERCSGELKILCLWPSGLGKVPHKILDQFLSPCQTWINPSKASQKQTF